MDARTAEALEKSIEHWREICDAQMNLVNLGPMHCALCRMFHSIFDTRREDCKGCPVSAVTGATLCRETPYPATEAAYEIWEEYDEDDDDNDEAAMQEAESAFRAAARAELAFLESLREPVKEPQQ